MLNIMACRFKRTETSQFESGVIINEGDCIIDMQGKPVTDNVWTWNSLPYSMCLHYKPEE